MNPKHDPWMRLVRLARPAMQAAEDAVSPPGFSTRTAAAWVSRQRPEVVWEFFSLRALGIACLVLGLTIAVNLTSLHRPTADEDLVLADPLAQEVVQP